MWNKVEFWGADDKDYAAIENAAAQYRSHWVSFQAMPFAGTFDGGPDDIRALDYLDDEGLDDPPGGIEVAALTWGRVLAHETGLRWYNCHFGGLWLRCNEPSLGAVSIWPLARVAEAQSRSSPQFGKYLSLTKRVLRECIAGFFEDCEVSTRMERLLIELGDN